MADYPMNESMILEEEIDENYEPTQDGTSAPQLFFTNGLTFF